MVDVIYADNHLLVLNKPAGMLTQPNDTHQISLEALGKTWVKSQLQKPGNVFLVAVHRLDRPVSGLVLFARTSKALSRLNASLRNQSFSKEYRALVQGELLNEGVLEHELEKKDFYAVVATQKSSTTKKCLLKYQSLQSSPAWTLLKISLLTGRYHQIRAQLSAVGHPVLGDRKYGSSFDSEFLFLHHKTLSFPHPITQLPIQCSAPYPRHWLDAFPNLH